MRISGITRSSVAALEATAGWLTHVAPPTIGALCVLLIGVLGGIDLLTVREANIGVFYVLPVCMAAWAIGGRAGLAAAVAAALVRTVAYANDVGASSPAVLFFNAASALTAYGVVALLLGTVRRHFDDTRLMADTDPLTGVLNKRAFMEAADAALAGLDRRGGALLLAYLDLDGFKAVDDSSGHAAGDQVLRAFADAARREIDAEDLLGRVGGDEFVLLRAIGELSDGYAMAEAVHARLCDALGALPHDVTCSMGAVIVQAGDIADHQRLLALADALMYEVKRDGKNSLRLALAAEERGFAPPPLRAGEAVRQAAVDRLDLARKVRSPVLQAMVREAAGIIGTPIAAVSIIDHDRQWFVAEDGLDVAETPRAVSFCAHTIDGDGALVVNDAALDARFGGNPLVRGAPGIRFYAGAPLVTSEGHKLGALCVIDTRPRDLSDDQTAALTALAARVACALELELEQGAAD
jgi:diguanylate cyclase (GGDEF)-like protein